MFEMIESSFIQIHWFYCAYMIKFAKHTSSPTQLMNLSFLQCTAVESESWETNTYTEKK